jgi:aminopeptidase N
MAERQYKYQREDFGEMAAAIGHLDIYLNFFPDRVEAQNTLHLTARQDLSALELDARDLEIQAVERLAGEEAAPASYKYLAEQNRLRVRLEPPVKAGDEFVLSTRTVCHPSDHLLEGIYKDATPDGAPQQFMSQCQQWGFQRIMPIIDDCRAKCTMTTTLEGDAAYTHLISNGNIDRAKNPSGRPEPKPGDPSRQVITFDNQVPMAPYLYIAVAGTWDELADQVVYPSGRKVRLEYLVPPGHVDEVRLPMEILKKSVLWIEANQEYEYPHDTYRTITMTKSNYGGMENVGNTTIVTDAALVDEHTLDPFILYAHAVIVHEFEHNQCGSQTTMATPFDFWLNEGFTVDVERRFVADMFDPSFVRLRQVDSMRDPLLGPLSIEDGGHIGRISRTGFNDPDELVDGVTYVKSAEVIRMLRLIVGPDKFREAWKLYFERYKDSNADSDQFFACFQEVSGRDLSRFQDNWLNVIGYPPVSARSQYDPAAGTMRIELRQTTPDGVGPFHLPLELALVDENGRDIPGTAQVKELDQEQDEVIINGLSAPPAFVSLNRDCSFYGVCTQEGITSEQLIAQAKSDPNHFNRVEAMRALSDAQRIRLLHDPEAKVDRQWLDLFGYFLRDDSLNAGLKSYLLRIEEQPLDRGYLAWYAEQVAARERMVAEVNQAWREELIAAFKALDTYQPPKEPADGIEERGLKAVLLDLITGQDDARTHELILEHWNRAVTASDRVSALVNLNHTSAPQRRELLEQVHDAWHGHLSGYANYLRVISAGNQPDCYDMIAAEMSRPGFDITLPTHARALLVGLAANNRMVYCQEGLTHLADWIIKLAPINANTAGRMLSCFKLLAHMRPPLKDWASQALWKIAVDVSDQVSPTVHRQAKSYIDE